MTAIKHTLNRDVFLPNDERLIGFVHVTKVGRKKKTSFLCAACKFFFLLNSQSFEFNICNKQFEFEMELIQKIHKIRKLL